MSNEVVSMGTMYLDINAYNFPYGTGLEPGREVVGGAYEIVAGGSALNFARFCTALDLDAIFIGKVGNDSLGKVLEQQVKKTGVRPALIISDDVQTNIGTNYLGEAGASIMTAIGSANQALQGGEVLEQLRKVSDQVGYLYLGGAFKLAGVLPHYEDIASYARTHGTKVVLDHGRITNAVSAEDRQKVRDVIGLVDYYLPSKDEFLGLWGAATIEEGIEKVRGLSDCMIVIKDAQNGAIGSKGTQYIHVPSFHVQVKNSVGAGDCFNAGFIKAQTLGFDLQKSMRFACATAAIKISQDNLPSASLVMGMMDK